MCRHGAILFALMVLGALALSSVNADDLYVAGVLVFFSWRVALSVASVILFLHFLPSFLSPLPLFPFPVSMSPSITLR